MYIYHQTKYEPNLSNGLENISSKNFNVNVDADANANANARGSAIALSGLRPGELKETNLFEQTVFTKIYSPFHC